MNKCKKDTNEAGKIYLVNASRLFTKGNPKNYIDDESADIIVNAFIGRKEVEKFSRLVTVKEIEKNDYNLSPSRYIHTADDVTHREIAELITELHELEEEARLIDKEIDNMLVKIDY